MMRVRAGLLARILLRTMRTLLVVGLIACPWRAAFAEPSDQVPVGPRAIAMGGAYSSLALDASAMFWNPAGLSWIGHQELAGAFANLYQSDVKDNYAAFVLPISRRNAVGMDWYHSGFDDSELSFGENRFDLTWAMQIHRKFSAGLTAKYLTRDTDLDGAMVNHGSGVGMDIGALANPLRGLRLGLVAQDVFDTSIHYSGGNSTLAFPRNVRAGASYNYRDRAVLACDVDDRWHVGAEVWPLDLLALRVGMEDDRKGSEAATLTTGIGIKAGIFRVDYAYVIPPTLSATSHFGLTMAFNFNPAQVRIEKIETDEIFASLYKTYARVPIGRVVVRNLSDKALDTRVSVQIPGLMDEPTERSLTLGRGAAETIELLANLSSNTMELNENNRKQVRVSASYKSDRLERTDRASASVVVYAPGVIDWSRGVEQAAAFITTDDPVVDSVATRATRLVPALAQNPFASRNVANAAAIFDALTTLGVSYIPDPNAPYPTASDRADAVDRINYPRQTLAKRAGDCDDTTVLLAALLGHVGIPTKLVDIPGHLFLLFDSGHHERDRLSLGIEEGLFEVVDDGVWIPVETTSLREGFAEAWRIGAAKYAASQANHTLSLVDVPGAQARFESSLPAQSQAVPVLDSDALLYRMNADADVVAGWRADYLATHFPEGSGEIEISADTRDELAHINYLAGEIGEAVHQLEAATHDRPQSARAHNNLGDAHAARGELAAAIEDYRRALDLDPDDAGIWLNRGLVLHASGDTTAAADDLAHGLTRSGGYEQACRLLGLSADDSEAKGSSPQARKAQTRRLLRATLGRISFLDSLRSTGTAAQPTRSKLKPIRPMSAASRGEAADDVDLRSFLYWRERE